MSFSSSQGAIRYSIIIDDTNARQKIQAFSATLKNLDLATGASAKQWGALNNAMNPTITTSTTMSKAMQGLKDNFGSLFTSIGTLTSSALLLKRGYEDLNDAQIVVDRTLLKLSKSNEALTKAQDKVTQLIKEGSKGSKEYEQALVDLQQAQEQVSIAERNHSEALEAQQRTFENFYLNIFNTAISSVGTFGTALKALEEMGIPALTAVTKGVKLLGSSLTSLTTMGVVGLVLTGLSLVILKLMEWNNAFQQAKQRTEEFAKGIETDLFKVIHDATPTIKEYQTALANIQTRLIANRQELNQGKISHEKWNEEQYKLVNDAGIIAKKLNLLESSQVAYNASMEQGIEISQKMEIVITGLQVSMTEQIQTIERNAIALGLSKDAEILYKNALALTDSKLATYLPKIDELAEARAEEAKATAEAEAAWQSYLNTIKSFSDQMLGMDKKGFKDFWKDVGFDSKSIAKLWKQNIKQADFSDIFGDIRNAIMGFDRFEIDDKVFTKWIKDIRKRIEAAVKNTPGGGSLAEDLAGLNDAKTPEQLKTKFVELLKKIQGDPRLQEAAAKLGIDTSTNFATGLGEGFAKLDMSKFIKIDDKGGVATVGNPLAGMIRVMTTSIDQTVLYVTKAIAGMRLVAPAVDLSKYAGSLNDAVKAASVTSKNVTKNLEVKWPAIDMKTYAGNLNDAVKAAKDTRSKIEKALQSEIKIKITFDEDKLPSYKVKTSDTGYKLVKAAEGYQGWIRGGKGQMFLAGEAGEDEFVSITPKSKINSPGMGAASSFLSNGVPVQITLNINGNDIIDSKKIVRLIRDITGRNTSRHL